MNLKGKSVLITGASSGIGESFAYLLAEKGSHLILVARSLDKMQAIATEIRAKHQVDVHVYAKDLSVPHSSQELYDQLKADQVKVDILINNAGFGKWGRFESFSMQENASMVQLNITALMELCYLFVDDFKAKPEAGIINVGSTASFLPVPFSAVYGATKTFVLNFTEALVGELDQTNIRISCLCPSGTASNFAAVASTNSEAAAPSEELMSSDEVAKLGLDAFLANKHYVVTGRKSSIFMTKILSRKKIIDMVGSYWRKRLSIKD